MISYYSGTPGSGKSLHVAMQIYDWIQRGKNVIANFDVREDLIKKSRFHEKGAFLYLPNEQILDDSIDPVACLVGFAGNFHHVLEDGTMPEGQTLIVFDEGGILFNSRDWQTKYRMRWLWFFSQHRKFGFEVVIISQAERQIDRQVRANFEYEYTHKRVGNFKKLGKLLEFFSHGKLFCYVVRWYGIKGQDGRVHAEFFRGSKKYYRLYNTSRIFAGGPV